MIIVLKLSILSAIITLFWTIKTITTKKMKATIEKEYPLTEWVDKEDMTDLEKEENPTYITTGGYLKVYEYQEAWRRSYDNVTREEQLVVKNLPNFDAEVFYEISGIKIDEILSNPKEITIGGATYRLVEGVSNGY